MIVFMPMSISEAAKRIGVRPSTIRYYERIGDSSSGASDQRTAAVRCRRAASPNHNSDGAADWLYADRDQETILWISRWNTAFCPLAQVEEAEDRRTGCDVEAHPGDA